jgi:hypothetical protein
VQKPASDQYGTGEVMSIPDDIPVYLFYLAGIGENTAAVAFFSEWTKDVPGTPRVFRRPGLASSDKVTPC